LGEEVRQGAFLGEKGGAVDKLLYAAMKSTSREQRNKVEHNRELIDKMDSERAGRVREADIVLYSRIWRFLSVNARHSAFYFGWRAVKGLLDFRDRHEPTTFSSSVVLPLAIDLSKCSNFCRSRTGPMLDQSIDAVHPQSGNNPLTMAC
jgi:hypothetical protein